MYSPPFSDWSSQSSSLLPSPSPSSSSASSSSSSALSSGGASSSSSSTSAAAASILLSSASSSSSHHSLPLLIAPDGTLYVASQHLSAAAASTIEAPTPNSPISAYQIRSTSSTPRLNRSLKLKVSNRAARRIHHYQIAQAHHHQLSAHLQRTTQQAQQALCLCPFSTRFAHTFEQHHRLKLDNLVHFEAAASTSSTSSASSSAQLQLVSNSAPESHFVMGQKVSSISGSKNGLSITEGVNNSPDLRQGCSTSSSRSGFVFDLSLDLNAIRAGVDSLAYSKPKEPKRPDNVNYLLDMIPVREETQRAYGWNSDDRSLNMFVLNEDPRVVHRHPVAQSTDCVRGLKGFTTGVHMWEIKWPQRQRGTHAVVGVATKDGLLHSAGYVPLVGGDNHSWGWDLSRNVLYHNHTFEEVEALHRQRFPWENSRVYDHQFGANYQAPETFLVVLDMEEGTLSFMADGQYLGVAFRGLRGKILYPIVSCVWGHCEITMKYINGIQREPVPLKELARRAIRSNLGPTGCLSIDSQLNIPKALRDYLKYRDHDVNTSWKPIC